MREVEGRKENRGDAQRRHPGSTSGEFSYYLSSSDRVRGDRAGCRGDHARRHRGAELLPDRLAGFGKLAAAGHKDLVHPLKHRTESWENSDPQKGSQWFLGGALTGGMEALSKSPRYGYT